MLPSEKDANFCTPIASRRVKTERAARHIGLATATLETDRATGKLGIPFYKIGRAVIYDLDELDAWLAARRHTAEVVA